MLHPQRTCSDYGIDLLLRFAVGFRMFEELVEGKGQETRCRLVAGDEEGDEIVGDARVAEFLAGLGVHSVQHGGEKVFPVDGVRFSRLENAIGHVAENADVLPVLSLGAAEQKRGEGRPTAPVSRLYQVVSHGADERVQLVVVERVEAVVHGAQGEDVEGEAREVVGDHDGRVGAFSGPLERHLAGDVVHLVEHASNRHGPKGGGEDAMRQTPVGLIAVRLGPSAPAYLYANRRQVS